MVNNFFLNFFFRKDTFILAQKCIRSTVRFLVFLYGVCQVHGVPGFISGVSSLVSIPQSRNIHVQSVRSDMFVSVCGSVVDSQPVQVLPYSQAITCCSLTLQDPTRGCKKRSEYLLTLPHPQKEPGVGFCCFTNVFQFFIHNNMITAQTNRKEKKPRLKKHLFTAITVVVLFVSLSSLSCAFC